MQTGCADRKCGQKVRKRKKRQKVYSSVKFRSDTREKMAETVQSCKGKVAKRRKNGRNFTSERAEGADRMCGQEAKRTKLL